MIIISDGDPRPASQGVLNTFKRLKVKVTSVAVGAHGAVGHAELKRIATATGGKYYVVKNPKALPRIYQREARRVARPLVKEKPLQPRLKYPHEIMRGIDGPPPMIKGFVQSTKKDNTLVEVLMVSPEPADEKYATLLACWTYDLGRTAVLTTDAGHRWADEWTTWPQYDKFFTQLVRWSMRPTGDSDKFTVATEARDGKVRVVITALDEKDDLKNFLNMEGTVLSPKMESQSVAIRQIAPGRYEGEFEGSQAGSYFLTVTTGPGKPPIRTGVNVPYSSEFRDRATNYEFIKTLAQHVPEGGQAGLVTPPLSQDIEPLLQVNSYRRDLAKAISSQDIWPLLVLLGSCVFLADVFVRRVTVNFDWLPPMIANARDKLLGREPPPPVDERLLRLRNRKDQLSEQIDERRAAARFEPEPDAHVDLDVLTAESAAPVDSPRTSKTEKSSLTPAEAEQESYTERLLKAKKKAQKDQRRD